MTESILLASGYDPLGYFNLLISLKLSDVIIRIGNMTALEFKFILLGQRTNNKTLAFAVQVDLMGL